MYKLIIGSMEEDCDDLDQAMYLCFGLFPDADFSGYNENDTESWLDIKDGNETIGKIVELTQDARI